MNGKRSTIRLLEMVAMDGSSFAKANLMPNTRATVRSLFFSDGGREGHV